MRIEPVEVPETGDRDADVAAATAALQARFEAVHPRGAGAMDVGASAMGLRRRLPVGGPNRARLAAREPREPPLIIATWNVNSVRQRLPHLLDYLKEKSPDALCLQEIKCLDEAFPRAEIEDLGYNVATHGQKTFNGVAILAKRPIEVARGLPGDPDDEQARYIEAVIPAERGARAARQRLSAQRQSGAGREIRLQARLHGSADPPRAPAARPMRSRWCWPAISTSFPSRATPPIPSCGRKDALFLPQTRAKFRELMALGLTDALRATTDEAGLYTFWDYQAGAWQKNNGIRIDHLLLSPQAADRLAAAEIDKDMRGREKASDHVPVRIELDDA